MKKYFLLLNCCVVLAAGRPGILAQTAVDIAARQEAEERNKRLNATVEELKEMFVGQQKTIASLREEVRQLRDESARAGNNAVSQDTVRRLAEKIQEVDRKRESDNKLILENLGKLQKTLATPPVATPKTSKSDAPSANPVPSDKAIEYTVQKGDRLDLIVKSVREQHVNVTQKQVRDANPSVNWDKLRVGQKIFIPLPAGGKSSE